MSVVGKDANASGKTVLDGFKTGLEVDGILFNLIAHAYDSNENVRLSISIALHEVGLHRTEVALASIANYISKRASKIDQGHRVQLLKILVNMLENAKDKVSPELATELINFAATEMTSSQEVQADWQVSSSDWQTKRMHF
jgi:hypothetical protein